MKPNNRTTSTKGQSQYYRVFFELTSNPLVAVDYKGLIVDLNSSYITTFFPDSSITKDNLLRDVALLKPMLNPNLFDLYTTTIQSKAEDKGTFNLDIKIADLEFNFVVNSFPIFVENEIVGYVFCHEDITKNYELKRSLQKKNRQLNELQEVAGLGSWELDLSTGKADWTRKEYVLLGYDDKEVEALPDNFLRRIHKDDKERALKELEIPFEKDGSQYESEFRLCMPGGKIRHVSERGQVIKDKNNKPLRYVGTTLDITRRKEAEEELKNYRDHLEDIIKDRTKELEAFSYSLSHDLRAPLRSINGFCSALYEDYYETLDDVGKDYFKRIQASTNKMDHMIEGMFLVAKISHHQIEIEEINLSGMVRSIVNDQLAEISNRKIEVEIQENIIVNSDSNLLFIAMSNLIENALKYSSKQQTSRLSFGIHSEVTKGMPIYYIRDNGIGFDMQYKDKLFATFQRLHSENEIEGTGIGLSTVRRVFSHLNGRIWAESEVGKGATFYFILSEEAQLDKKQDSIEDKAQINSSAS